MCKHGRCDVAHIAHLLCRVPVMACDVHVCHYSVAIPGQPYSFVAHNMSDAELASSRALVTTLCDFSKCVCVYCTCMYMYMYIQRLFVHVHIHYMYYITNMYYPLSPSSSSLPLDPSLHCAIASSPLPLLPSLPLPLSLPSSRSWTTLKRGDRFLRQPFSLF